MSEDQVKLFGAWASPYSRRVELALKIKGIPYEYKEEDIYNKSAELLRYNPVHKMIPVLVHNGRSIAESLVIIEYIDETWKNKPLLPSDPHERARARFWAKFADEKIMMTARNSCLRNDEERAKGIEETCQQVEFLEKELRGKDFLGGDDIGYADIVAITAVYWVTVMQEVIGREIICEVKFPAVSKWIKKLFNIDVVKECTPPREKHIAFIKARFEFLRSASEKQSK